MKLTAAHGVLGLLAIALLSTLWNMIGAPLLQSYQGSLDWLNWWLLPIAIVLAYGGWAARKDDPVWTKRFFYWVSGGLMVFAFLIITFGEEEVLGATQQDLFIGDRPNAMGWTNINGDFIVVHGLTPYDCVPAGYAAFDANGNIFPFHQTRERGNVACYKNGIPLIPNSRELTPDVSNLTPQGLVSKLTETPAERAAAAAAEQAKIDAAHQRRIDLLQARNPAPDPSLQPVKRIVPACGSGWAEVPIPSKTTVHTPWNVAAATYEWRDIATGTWVKQPQGGVDKVRFCAKHTNYVGDEMIITFSPA